MLVKTYGNLSSLHGWDCQNTECYKHRLHTSKTHLNILPIFLNNTGTKHGPHLLSRSVAPRIIHIQSNLMISFLFTITTEVLFFLRFSYQIFEQQRWNLVFFLPAVSVTYQYCSAFIRNIFVITYYFRLGNFFEFRMVKYLNIYFVRRKVMIKHLLNWNFTRRNL